MSSSPTEPFLISTRLRDTEFKNALDAVPLGAEVEVDGPFGSFSLTDKRVVMDPKAPVPAQTRRVHNRRDRDDRPPQHPSLCLRIP